MRSVLVALLVAGCGSTGSLSTRDCVEESVRALGEDEAPTVELASLAGSWVLGPLDQPEPVAMDALAMELAELDWDGPWVETTVDDSACGGAGARLVTVERQADVAATVAGVPHDRLAVTAADDAVHWAIRGVDVTEDRALVAVIEAHYGEATTVDAAEVAVFDDEWELVVWTSGGTEGSHRFTGPVARP